MNYSFLPKYDLLHSDFTDAERIADDKAMLARLTALLTKASLRGENSECKWFRFSRRLTDAERSIIFAHDGCYADTKRKALVLFFK